MKKNNIIVEAFVITLIEGMAGGVAQNITNGNVMQTAAAAAVAGVIGVLFFHWNEIIEDFDIGEIIKNILVLVATLALVLFLLSKGATEYKEKEQMKEGIENVKQVFEKEKIQKQKFSHFREQIISGKNNLGKVKVAIFAGADDPEYQYLNINGQPSYFGITFHENTNLSCQFTSSEHSSFIRRISSLLFAPGGGNHYWKAFLRSQYDFGFNEEPKYHEINHCIDMFWDKPQRELLFIGEDFYSVDKDSVLFDIISFDYAIKNLK